MVRIGRDGQVEAHTEGTLGPRCLDAIPLLEALLESVVTKSRYTRDFYADSRLDVVPEQVVEEGEVG